MKRYLIVLFLLIGSVGTIKAQSITGKVVSWEDEKALPGASIRIKNTSTFVKTSQSGEFILNASKGQVLLISYTGFESGEFSINDAKGTGIIIRLKPAQNDLKEVVVSTGYQNIARERATGSFSHLNSTLLNRSTSTDILSRLEGVTPGLAFDRRRFEPELDRSSTKLRIRGESSINSNKDPLIVLDNFPYEGDINNINPNDVESITVLKDAAAASIWGARAGNGVIVITSKKGSYNRPVQVTLNTSFSLSPKPDLNYNRNFISASDFVDAEIDFFEKGFYGAIENDLSMSVLSPVVETLIAARDGLISDQVANSVLNGYRLNDLRKESLSLLYQPAAKQQYSLSLAGGGEQVNYIINAGYDRENNAVKGNSAKRLILNTQHQYRPAKGIEISAGLYYTNRKDKGNGIGYSSLGPSTFPYARLADEDGNPLAIVKDFRHSYVANVEQEGLLDWLYRPLDEISLNNNEHDFTELRVNTGVRIDILKGLSTNLNYQYQKESGGRRNTYNKGQYYVRDLVNRFTQADGTRRFPYGDILDVTNDVRKGYTGRAQLNYNNTIKSKHTINLIAGGEIREWKVSLDGFKVFGFDSDILTYTDRLDYLTRYPVRPLGTAQLPSSASPMSGITDRYVSYYANGSYNYLNKYTLSGSARVDGSNIFGVKTNQRSVPLWSAGLAWNLEQETWLKKNWLQELKLRATYGYNGNSDNSVTAFVTASYSNDPLTGESRATIRNPGNPQLRWEKIAISNLGLDFSVLDYRVKGSVDYYLKRGKDLLGDRIYDPTAGLNSSATITRVNYASTFTKGLDLELNTVNTTGQVKWASTILFSFVQDKVTHYEQLANVSPLGFIDGITVPPSIGKSLSSVYSLPWYGLDALGDPLVLVDGVLGKDYSTYLQQLMPAQLIYSGRSIPVLFGAFRNTFTYKKISVSANFTWKAGYYFKRSGLSYGNLFNNRTGNVDFARRWRQPGDEALTQVPSFPGSMDSDRDAVYELSSLMVEKGDHIRLQDVNVSYDAFSKHQKIAGIRNLRIYFLANNLGIISRANKLGLDPDAPLAIYPPNATYSIGLRANFN